MLYLLLSNPLLYRKLNRQDKDYVHFSYKQTCYSSLINCFFSICLHVKGERKANEHIKHWVLCIFPFQSSLHKTVPGYELSTLLKSLADVI